jgi:hypothetical protein
MAGSGIGHILVKMSLPGTRALLAFFVAWGSLDEIKRPLFAPILEPPSKAAELSPGPHYWITWKYMQRGWPLVYLVRTNAPSLRNEDDLVALACDLAFAGVLTIAAWKLLPGWRLRFGLADVCAVTTALAATMAFHIETHGHSLYASTIALDVGVFAAGLTLIRAMRKFAAALRSRA